MNNGRNRSERPVEILLVEDNPGDVRLAREALREGGVSHRLSVVFDGESMLGFLRREGVHADAPRPDIILLDLNLPGRGGLEVLEEIKEDSRFRQIPVMVLSMSRAGKDILMAYDRHANCYISKPIEFEQFIQVMRGIERFWFDLAQLPPRGGHDGG